MTATCEDTVAAYGNPVRGCGETLIPILDGGGFVCPHCDGPAVEAIIKKERP